MVQLSVYKNRFLVFSIAAALAVQGIVGSAQSETAQRINELRRLRDELQLSDSLRNADIILTISERTIAESVRRMVGLEIVLSNGNTLRITSVETDLVTAAAVVKIGVQAKSTVTVNMQLTGRIGTGEVAGDSLRMPFKITDVSLSNSRLTALFIKTLLGKWRSPETWNQELPPLEIPFQLSEAMEIPASRIDVAGSMPMEVATPEYRAPVKFVIANFLVLENRAVLGLRMAPYPADQVRASFPSVNNDDPRALEKEIDELSSHLTSGSDLRLRIKRGVLSAMLEKIASAHQADFKIKLKQGRIRTEEVEAVIKITNYTDVESGEGQADISKLSVDRIADGNLNLRLSGQGTIDARVRGREYGIPYRLSPRTKFTINDKNVPLQFVSEGERVVLKAAPGSTLPVDVRFSIRVAGRDAGINRKVALQADRWLSRIEMPSFFGREILLPQKLELDAGGNLHVTKKRKLNYLLSGIRLSAVDDVLDIAADVAIESKQAERQASFRRLISLYPKSLNQRHE